MKILILSINEDNDRETKLCLFGIQFGDFVFGITIDWDWSN